MAGASLRATFELLRNAGGREKEVSVASEFPIIVGVGQITNRSVDAQTAKEPLELMELALVDSME